MKKNLIKSRSWELTIDELKEKQNLVRKFMWCVFIIFSILYSLSILLYAIGYKQTCLMFMGLAILTMILLFFQKYYEINFNNIIEIRMMKEK